MFRLRGQGMPNVHGHGQGDLLVRIAIEVPSRLSRSLREKLEELAAITNDDAYPQRQSFLDRAKRFFGGK
jgi:molecular chaperone DnaJ